MPEDYLDAALNSITPNGDEPPQAVSIETLKNVQDCYRSDFIRAYLACNLSNRFTIRRQLREKFKKFSVKEFDALAQEADANLRPKSNGNHSAMLVSENGNPRAILANAIIQLKTAGVDLAYDTFASKVYIRKPSPWGTNGAWSDQDDSEAADYLQHNQVMVGSILAREAAHVIARRNKFHPVRDWLMGLKWDGEVDKDTGESRLDTWMSRLLGTPDSELMRSACRKWTISAVGRIMQPGCKADHMIVLEGPEGKRKSLALHALVNGHLHKDTGVQWFRDRMPDIDKKDVELYMQGVWLIEIAELDAIRGKEWTRVNAFISSAQDTFRVPYGHNMADYPRQCVFAASTNEEHWNATPYGGRRFWPVPVRYVSIDKILAEREQIWAEAMFRYNEGETNFLSDDMEALMREQQLDRAPDDPLFEAIQLKVLTEHDISVDEVLEKIGERRTPANARSVGTALRKLGWDRYRPSGVGTRPPRYRLREE